MQSLTLIFITSFIIALSGALMPGPMLTVTIANSSKRGFWVGPLVVLGHGILECVLIVLILVGFGPFLRLPQVLGIVGIIGGLVLGWLGILMIRNRKPLSYTVDKNDSNKSGSSVLYGILTSLSNPYWTLWWATVGMGYLAASYKFGMTGVFVFFIGHILADLAWYSLVSFAMSRGRQIIHNRIYLAIVTFCGVFLILFGAWFFYFGWGSLWPAQV